MSEGLGPRSCVKNSLAHFAHPSSNFYGGGVKKCQIWPQFLTPVASEGLKCLVLKNSNIFEICTCIGSVDDCSKYWFVICTLMHIENVIKVLVNAHQLPKYPYHIGNRGGQIQGWCQNFERMLRNAPYKFGQKQLTVTGPTLSSLQVAVHHRCHFWLCLVRLTDIFIGK